MTSELPPQVAPRTPREPELPRGKSKPSDPKERPRRPVPPKEFMRSRRDMMRSFADLRRGFVDGSVDEVALGAYAALIAEMKALSAGEVTGQEVIDKLS